MFKKEEKGKENSFSEYIHTMKDDFDPKPKNSPVKSIDKNNQTSPFLSNNPQELKIKKENPQEHSNKSVPKKSIPKDILKHDAPSPPQSSQNILDQENNKIKTKTERKKGGVFRKILVILIFLLILSSIGLGAYYYLYLYKDSQQENPPMQEDSYQEPAIENEQITITPSLEKYSLEQPNFLLIDIESSSTDEIKNHILSTANEIQEENTKTSSPFEFIITDKNNNPYAFPIFALAAELNLSEQLLKSLEENFSFYIYNDSNNVRVGLAIEIKNKETLLSELKKQEKTLVKDLSFLFLGDKPQTESVNFKSGVLNGVETRFVNLNENESLSIDYSIIDRNEKEYLLIGTSKKSMSAIIEKINDNNKEGENI